MTIGILNYQQISGTNHSPIGGFRHWAGLLPFSSLSGDPSHSTRRIFHVPAANTAAIFRGDIVCILGTGGADLPFNIYAMGGAPIGNPAQAGDIGPWTVGNTTAVIAGVVVGSVLTLQKAKNGWQFTPALTEDWLEIETDPDAEFFVTGGGVTLPTGGWAASIGAGVDLLTNATTTSTRFGISGKAIDPTTVAATATLPLRILGAVEGINNDVTDAPTSTAGNPVIRVTFNKTRHMRGTGGMVA